MTWGQLAEAVLPPQRIVPTRGGYSGGYEAGGRLAQITDDMIARQGYGADPMGIPAVFAVVRLIASTVPPQHAHPFQRTRLANATGERPFTDILETRRTLLSTQLEYLEAQANVGENRCGGCG